MTKRLTFLATAGEKHKLGREMSAGTAVQHRAEERRGSAPLIY